MRVLRTFLVLLGLVTVAACSAPQVSVPASLQTTASAPVTAAPAPVEDLSGLPRSFTVCFEHDSAEIRASAMQVLWEAAQVANKLQPTLIRVNGFTDGIGNRSYNQKLSNRRAAAVATQLIKLGIQVAVSTTGQGVAPKLKGARKDARLRRVEVTFEGGHSSIVQPTTAAFVNVPVLSVPAAPLAAAMPAVMMMLAQCSAITADMLAFAQCGSHDVVAGIVPQHHPGTGPPV